MWEETLVFTVHMPEIALVRFLVWDHDPIGRDFIGQRTLAFSSMMPGKESGLKFQHLPAVFPACPPQELLTSLGHKKAAQPIPPMNRRSPGPTQGPETFEESVGWQGEEMLEP